MVQHAVVCSPPHETRACPGFAISCASWASPTCGGEGLGVAVDASRATTTTPLPNPPPQGGREHTERVARSNTQPIGRIVVFLACLLLPSIASAQTPLVIDEWKFGRRQEASTLHYCVDARDPDLPVARKIGAAIAAALLLQGKEHV